MSNVDLFASVESGSVDEVRTALRQPGVDVNCRGGKSRNTALCEAVNENYVEIVRLLLKQPGIHVNAGDKDGNSPLHLAAVFNNVEIARRLLKHHEIDINRHSTTDESTPLCKAAWRGKLEMVEILLLQPAIDVNAADKGGNGPLHHAASKDFEEIVSRLLAHPATDVNLSNHLDESPLDRALEKGNKEIVNLLLQHPQIKRNRPKLNTDSEVITKLLLGFLQLKASQAGTDLDSQVLRYILNDASSSSGDREDNAGDDPLFHSVKRGLIEEVRVALQRPDVDVNCRGGRNKQTPLCEAADNHFVEILEALLTHPGIDVNAGDKDGNNPLHSAAIFDYVEIARRLLAHPQIDVNRPGGTDMSTPLGKAAWKNSVNMVDFLLKQSATNVNAGDRDGETPLLTAAWNNSIKSARRLLEHHGIDVNQANNKGKSPLDKALKKNHVELVGLLLQQPNIQTSVEKIKMNAEELSEFLNLATQKGYAENVRLLRERLNNPLGIASRDLCDAVRRGSLAEVRTALRHDSVDVNGRGGEFKRTALCEATTNNHLEIVDFLLEQPDIDVLAGDEDGNNPLHASAVRNHVDIAGRLLQRPGIDINLRGGTDLSTPLGKGSYKNSIEVVDLLLKQSSINVNVADKHGDTPLHNVCIQNNVEIASRLLEHPSINVNLANIYGQTPLDKALDKNHEELINLLLQHRDIQMTPENLTKCMQLVSRGHSELMKLLLKKSTNGLSGETLTEYLHLACQKGDAEVMELLRDRSNGPFDINSPREGITALHEAVNSGKEDVVQILLEMPNLVLDVAVGFEKFTPLHVAAQRGNAFAVESILRTHRHKILGVVDSRTNQIVKEEKISAGNVDQFLAGNNEVVSNVRHHQSTTANNAVVVQDQFTALVNARDVLLRTPLHYAAWNNGVEVVEQLLKEGSLDVNAADSDGYTALFLASKKGHVRVVELLLSNNNIDANITCKTSEEIRILAKDEDSPISEKLELPQLQTTWFDGAHSKMTPLHCALEEGHMEVAQGLLARSVIHEDEYLEDGDHKSIFHVAIRRGVLLQNLVQKANVQFDRMPNLIRHLANCAKDVGTLEAWNMLTFLWDIVKQTVRREFHPPIADERSSSTLTLLHDLAWAGLDEWMEAVLIRPGWEINAVDSDRQTPLHYAASQGHTKVVQVLVSSNLALRANEEDNKGRSALHIAIERKKKDIEKLLLEQKEVSDYVDRLYRDRQVQVDTANAILVGAALIASVTFGGWLQPPLGFTPYYGIAVQDSAAPPGTFERFAGVKQHLSLRAFWVCNSLSFFLAIATVIGGAWAVLPTQDVFIKEEVRMVRRALAVTSVWLVFAIIFVLGAFGASGFASLPPIKSLEANMIITCCIGVGICVPLLTLFLVKLSKVLLALVTKRKRY